MRPVPITLRAACAALVLCAPACTSSRGPEKAREQRPEEAMHEKEPSTPSASKPREAPQPPSGGKVVLSDEEWRRRLTPEQYRVCREKGTERAFTGKHWNAKAKGTYACVACGNALFSSETKFDSGTGWPSFWAPLSRETVELEDDDSLFMRRTEVMCARCGSHLGHVFDDGPPPTGKRYCMNSVALELREKEEAQ